MNKRDALDAIFDSDLIYEAWPITKFSAHQLLDVISKKNYCISRELNIQSNYLTKVLDYIYPDRPRTGGAQLCRYVLSTYGLRCCTNCQQVFDITDFSKDKTNKDGLSLYCNNCIKIKSKNIRVMHPEKSKEHSRNNYYRHKSDYIHRMTLRKVKIKLATPSWANLSLIKEVYNKRPDGMHVDHIVPLVSDIVCGLHVHNNLQYLSPEDNLIKSNKYDPMAE